VDIDAGRPLFKRDEGPRKRRVDKPKTKPGVADVIVWSESAWNTVSECISDAYIKTHKIKNLRQLTKANSREIEQLKIDVFTNLKYGDNVDNSLITKILKSKAQTPKYITKKLNDTNISMDNTSIDDYRRHAIGLFVEHQIG